MSKTQKIFSVILPILAICAAIILAVSAMAEKNNKARPLFRLQTIDGIVTLFEGETAVETYPDITLKNLPTADRTALQDGMEFSDRDAARRVIEDFDG